MKHLFVIRHGDNIGNRLTVTGEYQIKALAEDMRAIVGEIYNGHHMISSTSPRALESADIIARAFGLGTFNRNARLWTKGGEGADEEDLKVVNALVKRHEDENDVVTLVTHYELVNVYPRYAMRDLFGMDEEIPRPAKGRGIHIDIETESFQLIPRV